MFYGTAEDRARGETAEKSFQEWLEKQRTKQKRDSFLGNMKDSSEE